MRRLLLITAAAATLGALSAPALAAPPAPPVSVTHNEHGVCVNAFTWVPQCVPTDFIR